MASLPVDADGPVKAGEMGVSVAPKGEVNSDNQRAKTPAERLGLFDAEVARQVREVSGGSGLFRSPRRSGARPDRGGAGGDEPRLLRQISGYGVWRGLPEQAPPSRLPVHLCLRQQPRRHSRARHVGPRAEDRESDARRPALAAGSRQVDALPRLLGAPVLGQRDEEGCTSSASIPSTGRAPGATAATRRAGAPPPTTAEISAKLAEAAQSSAEQASAKR